MLKQKYFYLKCTKCGTEFMTSSYVRFNVEIPQMVAPNIVVNRGIQLLASPCPTCNCGVPIKNDTNWKWRYLNETRFER